MIGQSIHDPKINVQLCNVVPRQGKTAMICSMEKIFRTLQSSPHFILIAILLFAFVLRLPHLGGSFWLDEAAQALESRRPLAQQLQIVDDFQPPLIHLLVHFALYLGEAEWWLRTIAALIPGLVTIAALYFIAKAQGLAKYASIPALLLATSSFHIFYSQELRPYSLPAMWAVLGWLSMTHLTVKKQKHSLRWLVAWTVCNALGLYSSYMYPFAFFGQIVYLLAARRKPRAILATLGAGAIAAATFFPWLPSFLAQLRAGQTLRTDLPGWETVVSFTQLKALALTGGKFLFGVLDLSAHPLYLVSTAVVVAATSYILWSAWVHDRKHLWKQLTVFSCWVVLPILAAWCVSFWVPVVQPKRVLFALPGMYLFLGWLTAHAGSGSVQTRTRMIAGVLAGALLTINLVSTFSYYVLPKYQRENWRDIHAFITQKYSREDAVVVFAFPAPFASWEWYNRQSSYPTHATGSYVVSNDPTSPERVRLKTLTTNDFILVFEYLRDITDPGRQIEKDLERYGYAEVDRITPDTPIGIIKVYAKTGQILGYSEY